MFSKGFPQDNQVTYAGMLWLLSAQLVVMVALAFYLPVWLIPVLFLSAGWRIRVMKGHLQQPAKIVIFILGGLGIATLLFSGMKLVSLDMMASLLMLGFAYKSIEIIQRRDGMVVIFTGFLLIGVLFLYSQSILTAVYGIFALTILSGAMIAIQQSNSHTIAFNLRLASFMLVLCLPLMVLLFVFAPRFSPLWAVPLPGGQAKTGITDTMAPGDIAHLSQSDGLAFSVKFLGKRPEQNALYWRGLVLQHFDGNRWTQFADDLDAEAEKSALKTNRQAIIGRLVKKGASREYEVIYEKSAQTWLFALSPVVSIKGDAYYGADFQIIADQDVIEPMLLTLVSYPQALRDIELPEVSRNQALQLPEQGNAKSRALAQRLFESASTHLEYINKVLTRYQQETFYYTLRPPLLNRNNSIDDFLLNTKKGFCEHYAGSFVFMMRAVGIPSRVVIGYQGGEWNENGEFLAIHHFDAHAWAEVWLEDYGWVRYDPTTMVAPQRIEKNLEAAVKEEGSFLEAQMFSMAKNKWSNQLRKQIDSIQYRWRRFVLGYDDQAQAELLKHIFGEMSVQKIALIVGSIFSGIIGLWVLFLGLGRGQPTEAVEHQLYRRFCERLERQGVRRQPSQPPERFSSIASAQLPALKKEIEDFTRTYSTLSYAQGSQQEHQRLINDLKRQLKQMKKNC